MTYSQSFTLLLFYHFDYFMKMVYNLSDIKHLCVKTNFTYAFAYKGGISMMSQIESASIDTPKNEKNVFIELYQQARKEKELIIDTPFLLFYLKRCIIIFFSFVVPIGGYMIYIVQLDDDPSEAKYAGIPALLGFILNMLTMFYIFYSRHVFGY